jgi:RNA polymerase sigma-70 factor (ECF subfamily)
LYKYAYWLCGDPCLAEDLVQETFLRAWRGLDALKDERAARGWLFTILKRENARRFEREQPTLVDVDGIDLADTGHASPDLEAERSLVHRAILGLKLEQREPLALQMIGGFSCREIAQILGLEQGAVMMRLFRAKRSLAVALQENRRQPQYRT